MPSNPSYLQSTTIADNTACINNNYSDPIDFTIYSQDNPSELENDSFPGIHQVNRNPQGYLEESDLSCNYDAVAALVEPTNHIPSNHLTTSPGGYTPQNQSTFTVASPHGNSLNDNNPLLDFHTNLISPHLTPLTTSEPLFVDNILNSPYIATTIFSPVVNSTEGIIFLPTTPDPGTPYTVCTPLLTPYTPHIPFNSDHSTPRFVPNTPSTPFTDNFPDPPLYDTGSKFGFSLFGDNKPNLSDFGIGTCPPTLFYNMDLIHPVDEKKPEGLVETAVVPGTPNSDGSSSGSASEKSASPLSPTIELSEHQTEINSGSQVGENLDVNTEVARSPSSSTNSPVTTPRLVAIRPRPHEDDDDNSETTIRRSKRQKTRSVSENDEENEEDGEEKKYTCPDCGRGFNRKFNMQTHRATHDPNRVKPFACEHPNCGSRFTRKHDLKRHVNGIHRGERVHSCTTCNKPFSRKDAWKRHITTCGKM